MKTNMNMYFYMTIVFLTGLVGLFTSCGNQNRSMDTLSVGMMSAWAPFMTINQQGEYEGFDVDVAKVIAQRLGKKLVINDMGSLAPLFVALDQSKIEMVFSGLDITQSRLEKMTMVRYTGSDVTSFYLLFWKQIPANIKTIQDLKNIPDAVVCAEPGSGQEKYLDHFPFINKKSLGSVDAMVLDVQYGRSLAAIVEPHVAARFTKQIPELKMLELPLPKEFQVLGCGIAIKKENEKLGNEVAKIIQDMRADGSLQQFEKKWGLT